MERRFIPTKDDNYKKYLSAISKISEEEVSLKYEIGNLNIVREKYLDGDFQVIIDKITYPVNMTLVKVLGNRVESFLNPKGFIEVTNNSMFSDYSIAGGSIVSNNTIMEGTDGVGKSVTMERLLDYGVICEDRSIEYVSQYMFFDVPMQLRASKLEEYLINGDKCIVFLVNNSKEELERRINSRDVISEYDLEAYQYNTLYLSTYNYMLEHDMLHDKLYLVDCTNLTIDEQVSKVYEVIRSYNKIPNVKLKARRLEK